MLNLDQKFDESDPLFEEIEAALTTLPLRPLPNRLTTTTLLAVAEFEEVRAEQPGFDFWAWLDNAVRVASSPVALLTSGLVLISLYLFVFSDQHWQVAIAGVGGALGHLFSTIGSFVASSASPYLLLALLVVAAAALIPRVREVRALLASARSNRF